MLPGNPYADSQADISPPEESPLTTTGRWMRPTWGDIGSVWGVGSVARRSHDG
jgi:hypothetical protein